MIKNEEPLVSCRGLRKWFPVRNDFFSQMRGKEEWLKAVNGIDIDVFQEDMYCLAGESGCGKTTIGKLLIGLLEPTEGSVFIDGKDISKLSRREIRKLRAKIQTIFQDPYSSLNPRKPVRHIVGEAFAIHGLGAGDFFPGWLRRHACARHG